MALKHINIFQYKGLKIFPNWDFWFEDKPSGSPVRDDGRLWKTFLPNLSIDIYLKND
jgi:hypothetical protein